MFVNIKKCNLFERNKVVLINFINLVTVLVSTQVVFAAMEPRFEIDPNILSTHSVLKSKPITVKATNKPAKIRDKSSSNVSLQKNIHVVKAGDNLFKILMRDYALSNSEAEVIIERIRHENNIYDIKRLKVGQKLIIPPIRRNKNGTLSTFYTTNDYAVTSEATGKSFVLEAPSHQLSELEASARFKNVWESILPADSDVKKPITMQSPTFSLTLDPQRYPSYASMDGGRILVDSASTIPPLVKVLIGEKDPSIKLVTESPVSGRQFLLEMISAAGFYSVEEDFILEFGTDPKLIVRTDFKIEKTSDSLLKQDIVLMNAGRVKIPSAINLILKKEGFTLYEPFASLQPVVPTVAKHIQLITSKNQSSIVDSLLTSLSVTPDKDLRLEVLSSRNGGITLSVNAERYFVRNGQRNVVTRFDGDPVTYTLFRILETMGYQVTILDAQDGFKNITEKLLNRLQIRTEFGQHLFEPEFNSNYSLKLSGYKLDGFDLPQGGLFVTNLEVDHIIRDILTGNGYIISSK